MDANVDVENVKNEIKNALLPMIKALVDSPDAVVIDIYSGHKRTLIISITTEDDDVGKIVGRGGKHADAIRALTSAVAAKYNHRSIVEI